MVAPLDDMRDGEVGEPSPAETSATPRVLVRSFSVPSGTPWDQARAARLEARHAAPLPITELDHQLRRIAGWAPGRPGRYVVFYVRLSELRGPFESVVDVDGAPMKVAFGAAGGQLRRLGHLGAIAAIAAISVFLVVAGFATAVAARRDTDERLAAAERAVALKLRSARADRARDQQARDLARVVGSAAPLSAALSDLAWASDARDPAARITAVHWDHGLLAIESLGETSPFQASVSEVKRSAGEVRPGTWLWGVRPGASGGADALETAAPTAERR